MADLPNATHGVNLGYYYDDSPTYGNLRGELTGTVDAILVWGYLFQGDETALVASMADAISRSPAKLVFGPNFNPANWSITVEIIGDLDALNTGQWASVDAVYFDEPPLTKAQLETFITDFNAALTARSMALKPIWVNFSQAQFTGTTGYQATNVDVYGIEAYYDPAQQNSGSLQTDLAAQIAASKALIGAQPTFIVVQGYNRNGAWTNLTSLRDLQDTTYLAGYSDANVMAFLIFSYGREGGSSFDARSLQCVRNEHVRMWHAIQSTTQPTQITCSGAAGSFLLQTDYADHLAVFDSVSPVSLDAVQGWGCAGTGGWTLGKRIVCDTIGTASKTLTISPSSPGYTIRHEFALLASSGLIDILRLSVSGAGATLRVDASNGQLRIDPDVGSPLLSDLHRVAVDGTMVALEVLIDLSNATSANIRVKRNGAQIAALNIPYFGGGTNPFTGSVLFEIYGGTNGTDVVLAPAHTEIEATLHETTYLPCTDAVQLRLPAVSSYCVAPMDYGPPEGGGDGPEDPCAVSKPAWWTAIRRKSDATVLTAAARPLRDPGKATYPMLGDAAGYKEPRLLSLAGIVRQASDVFTGAPQSQSVTASYADVDFFFRGLFGENPNLSMSEFWAYLVGEARRLAFGLPRLMFRGIIYDDVLDAALKYGLTINDIVSIGWNLFSADKQIPARRITSADFPNVAASLLSPESGVPIVCGEVSQTNGAIPLINVGPITINNVSYAGCALVCGHAVDRMIDLYRFTGSNDTPDHVVSEYGVTVFCPDKPGWPLDFRYVELPGGRFTVVLLNGTDAGQAAADFNAGKAIYANVRGMTVNADGSGGMVENLLAQYLLVFRNFIIGQYATGDWLDNTDQYLHFDYCPAGITFPQVIDAGWQTADSLSQGILSGGFKGAFVIGAKGKRVATRDVITQFNTCCGNLLLATNYKSQFAVSMLNRTRDDFLADSLGNPRRAVDWRRDMKGRARKVESRRQWLANVMLASYRFNYTTDNYDGALTDSRSDSITRYGELPSLSRSYPMIRDDDTLAAVVGQQMDLLSRMRQVYTWYEGLCGLRNDVMTGIPVTDYLGSPSGGYVNRAMWKLSEATDSRTNVVTATGLDVDDLLS